ncbi:MAG: PQQ-dependent sugar dehydrogenase [Saprospiraceae bacterium]
MKNHITIFLLLFSYCLGEAQLPPGFAKFEIASGLNPTDMAIAPDGRVFLTEKDGLVLIVENGLLLSDAFIILDVEDYNEQGLGHIALDPDFPNQPFVYLYYTVSDSNGMSHNRVSRVEADGNYALPGTEVILYECDPTYGTVHNGGDLVFGADGKLYISTGDKSFGAAVQSMDHDLGKVLRINPDGSIPADNPFYTTNNGKYRAIYSLGLRNPFSMAMQPESGRIFACDVGNATWEEINEIQAGMNYGHPITEGLRTNEQVPVNYQDPWHYYHHSDGCSIVGAAFTPQSGGNFPADYSGKFFFADYCKGYINMINPDDNSQVTNFATDIDRPVALAVTPEGDLYLLARSGLGGGSEEDNTESEQGSLWKIIYTGSEAPFIYLEPKDALRAVGEDMQLETRALGRPPLHYQWQKNGLDLMAPDNNILIQQQVTLADSNSTFRCIVSNLLGSDTSVEAVLTVTKNQRPIPQILSPDSTQLYKAGSYVHYSGMANDPETGILDSTRLFWKIDFHHNDHLHPTMELSSGFTADSFYIQTVGEPSDNVWYRIHLTARDIAGLTNSTYRDVYPQKSVVGVFCEETSISVNADGLLGKTPYEFQSVAGLERSLQVPSFIDEGDSVLIFSHWNNGEQNPTLHFITADTGFTGYTAVYDKIAKANGFGLLGEYFEEKMAPFGFDEPFLLSRIDSMINFDWQDYSPAPGYVPSDGFTVRWTGQVVPYRDAEITFYTITDDGARLFIDNQLLIDEWYPQGTTQHAATLFLEGGKKYPIEFDFVELWGGATAKLQWSTRYIPQEPIPKRQLYPPSSLVPNSLSGFVWLDVDGNGQWDSNESPIPNTAIMVIDANTQKVEYATLTNADGEYVFPTVKSGSYLLYVLPPLTIGNVAPGVGLSASGTSDSFDLNGEVHLEQSFAYKLTNDSSGATLGLRPWDVTPNPSQGLVHFRKKILAYPERFQILVFDASGKLCLEKTCFENILETELDLRDVGSGVYFVWSGGFLERIVVN